MRDSTQFLDNLDDTISGSVDRQDVFDRFLTYRRRMARTVSVQVMYLRDINLKVDALNPINNEQENLFHEKIYEKKKISTLCQEIIYFYKYHIFGPKEYGITKQNRKVDEGFVFDLTKFTYNNIDKIDGIISQYLHGDWTVVKLDIILRNIFRVAVAEVLSTEDYKPKVISSEYTNIASSFYDQKIIGFANAVLDSICKNKNHYI